MNAKIIEDQEYLSRRLFNELFHEPYQNLRRHRRVVNHKADFALVCHA